MGYLDVLKAGKIKQVKLVGSGRRRAWEDQKGNCAKCKKDLNHYYCKYIEDKTKKSGFKVLCLDCFFGKK